MAANQLSRRESQLSNSNSLKANSFEVEFWLNSDTSLLIEFELM